MAATAIAKFPYPADVRDECIYNLIPNTPPPKVKAPRHKSQYAEEARKEYRSHRGDAATMGPAKVPVEPPEEFLRSRAKEPKLPEPKKYAYPDADHRRPAVPKHSEKPLMGTVTNKNFIVTNAIDNILAAPKKPADDYFDYRTKKDYGKVPGYMTRRADNEKTAPAHGDDADASAQFKMMTEDERETILRGLKANWERVNQAYQTMSLSVDSIMKRARKERYEAMLKQLEQDIAKIEKHRFVVVKKGDEY
eukprot:Opistho-2@85902